MSSYRRPNSGYNPEVGVRRPRSVDIKLTYIPELAVNDGVAGVGGTDGGRGGGGGGDGGEGGYDGGSAGSGVVGRDEAGDGGASGSDGAVGSGVVDVELGGRAAGPAVWVVSME